MPEWPCYRSTENQNDYAEGKINQIIYELYELTDEEIKLIEE